MLDNFQFRYIYTCYDPEVFPPVVRLFSGEGKNFFSSGPGAVKNILSPAKEEDRGYVIRNIKLAHEQLHRLKSIILINHSNCGAYRLAGIVFDDPRAEDEFHRSELEKAAKILKEELPGVDIEIHYFLKNEQKLAW